MSWKPFHIFLTLYLALHLPPRTPPRHFIVFYCFDLLSVPGTHQSHSHLKAFTRAISSVWNVLTPDMSWLLSLFRSLLKCHLLREATYPLLLMTHYPYFTFLHSTYYYAFVDLFNVSFPYKDMSSMKGGTLFQYSISRA